MTIIRKLTTQENFIVISEKKTTLGFRSLFLCCRINITPDGTKTVHPLFTIFIIYYCLLSVCVCSLMTKVVSLNEVSIQAKSIWLEILNTSSIYLHFPELSFTHPCSSRGNRWWLIDTNIIWRLSDLSSPRRSCRKKL